MPCYPAWSAAGSFFGGRDGLGALVTPAVAPGLPSACCSRPDVMAAEANLAGAMPPLRGARGLLSP